ncbi:restriction endonuclease [Bifidobacterium castoris]|nr:restriction endonuclease [Bifidobacterium castoris]
MLSERRIRGMPRHINEGMNTTPARRTPYQQNSMTGADTMMNSIFPQHLHFIDIAIAVIVAIALVALLVKLVQLLIQEIRRDRFYREYGVAVPKSMRIRKAKRPQVPGSFVLGYPVWKAAKRDGTRDRRSNDTGIIHQLSVILVGQWKILGDDPFASYAFVRQLRDAGTLISYCAEEQAKRDAVLAQLRARRTATSIDAIVQRFSINPSDFEGFCADLLRQFGWQAQVTPPTRDGGFDLKIHSPNGTSYIAECKCYNPRHHIGRPLLQKLQGANMTEHAQGLLFITTSRFTSDALEYAQQVGMELIDGAQLVRLCQEALQIQGDIQPSESSFMLTRADLMQHIPADMRV